MGDILPSHSLPLSLFSSLLPSCFFSLALSTSPSILQPLQVIPLSLLCCSASFFHSPPPPPPPSLSDSFCLLSLSVAPRFHLFMPPPSNAFFCTSSPSHTYTNTHKHSQTYTQDSQWSLTPSMSRSVALCSCRHSCSPNTICWRKREGTQLSSTFTGSPKSSTVLLQKSDRRFLIRTNLHFAAL